MATRKHTKTHKSASRGRSQPRSRVSTLPLPTNRPECVTWELGLLALAEAIRADSVATSFAPTSPQHESPVSLTIRAAPAGSTPRR